MKRLSFIIILLLTVQLSAKASNDKAITFEELPVQSQQFIKQHFANQTIALIKMDCDILDKSYEVIFTNGNKVEFNRRGDWKEIFCKQMPEEVIPSEIKKYVLKNYPNNAIVKIERESRGRHEIDLQNGLSLKFDAQYNLIDIDD
ncbi:PepSY-like domain-containing protein [Bacteroidales bacterium OttesenSCG-928-L14]|nr:PepSY-like domain-containing protein [Bacteroidales bacterium OttesenSCG-928-L14]